MHRGGFLIQHLPAAYSVKPPQNQKKPERSRFAPNLLAPLAVLSTPGIQALMGGPCDDGAKDVIAPHAGGTQPLLWVPALPQPHRQEARRKGAVQVLPHNSEPSQISYTRLVQHPGCYAAMKVSIFCTVIAAQ